MKKLLTVVFAIFLALSVSTGAWAEKTVYPSEEEILSANLILNILENHSSVTVSQLVWTNGDVCYQNFFKDDQGRLWCTSIWQDYQYISNNDSYLQLLDGELSAAVALGTNDFGIDQSALMYDTETEISYSTDEDGNIVRTSTTTLNAEMAESYGMSDGDMFLNTEVYSPESLIVTKYLWKMQSATTGLTRDYAAAVVHLDLDVVYPITLKALMDGACHRLTVVYGDGSTKEFRIPQGVPLIYALDEGAILYDDAMYATPHASQESETLTGDITLFYKAK